MTTQPQPASADEFVGLQARHNEATPGEWSIHPDWPGRVFSADRHVARTTGYNAEANAIAIVTAHNALPTLIARVREQAAELDRLRRVLASTQQAAELDSVTCLSCGHLESAHDPNGDRDCTASGAQVFSCSCSYFIPCYPEPTSGPAAPR